MFAAYCTTCSRRELIFAAQVLGIDNTAEGMLVTFRCGRGHLGRWRTGRQAAPARAALAA